MRHYDEHSDGDLLSLLRQSDHKAFATLYHRYWDRLLTVAANKLDRDIALAEELVQELFMDIWQRRETLHVTAQFSAYLATALKYKVIDARLKRARSRENARKTAGRLRLVDDSTREQIQFEDIQERLAMLVRDLPEKCQLVYRLSREAGYSQKQIAIHLDISEKTVESHLTRALRSLRAGLSHFFSLIL